MVTQKKPAVCKTAELKRTVLHVKVAAQHSLQQVVTIHLADHGTGILIGRNVGRVFGQDIAHQLIDRVVAFFLLSIIHLLYDLVDLIVLFIVDGENRSCVSHAIHPLQLKLAPLYTKCAETSR